MYRRKILRFKKEDKSQLIAAVRFRRLLWDVTDKEHNDLTSLKAAWMSVGAEMGRDPHECKVGWRSLRQCYRYHCKTAHSRSKMDGDDIEAEADPLETPHIKWEFADDMAFLQELSKKKSSDFESFDETPAPNSPLEDDTEYTDTEYLEGAYDENNGIVNDDVDANDTIDDEVEDDGKKPKNIMKDDVCRTCAQPIESTTAQNLFNSENDILLQVKMVTELVLNREEDLSDFICQQCLQNLEIAVEFRRVCIEAQSQLLLQVQFKEEAEQEILTYPESPTQHIIRSTDLDMEDEQLEDFVNSDNENYYEEKVEIQPLPTATPSALIRKKYKREPRNQKYQCHQCGLTFTNQDQLKMHMHQVHDVQLQTRFVCKHCGHDFKYSAPLVDHLKSIGVHFGHSCEECGQNFHSRHFLKKHKRRIHGLADEHICHICGKNFTTGFNLRNHIVRHTGTRPHKCKLCSAAFCTSGELNHHRRTHDNVRPYPCRYACGKTFRHCSNRSTHERIHMAGNLRPFQCEYCDKTFVTKGDCRAHQMIHTMSRDFSCDVCQQSFKLQKHYLQHLTTKSHKRVEDHVKGTKKGD
ncbi:GH22380 [Drosophila grimshawi]|uniref:GH22380 n=1 Tax=Drosophila grimshawi TaxID=7222 RepID=B4JYX6_DROGR|nr:GH22380 [Drosophila grimshawi]